MKFAFSLLSICLLLSSPAVSEDARTFSDISEVVENWNQDQKLWVSGSIGVAAPQLTALESWLDENGTNWTVVLMKNARSQQYDGKSGMTAVEFALGEGLANRTGFGKLTDPRTGEANGAVFVLFLEERKFSYFASEAFDKRGLGERYWVGRLDKPAINAMRSGGRIVDAAKSTVSSIETSLTRKLKTEEENKRLAEIEKQRAIDEAKQYPDRLDKRTKEVVQKTQKLILESTGTAAGPLFTPDIAKWEANAESIRKLVAVGSIQKAQARFAETMAFIDTYDKHLDSWAKAPARFEALEKQIATHPNPPEEPDVSGLLARSTEALSSSRQNHANGEPLYVEQLEEAERRFDQAAVRYRQWQDAESRKQFFIQLLSGIAAVAFLIFLIVSNRLRRPARDEANKLTHKWRRLLDGKFDELFSLMDRTSLVVGSSADLDERGFSGTTESLARKSIRGVDELFIMSAATDQVMQQVENLVEPKSLFGKILNTFSSRRYRKAISLLTSEPIGFDRKDHLEAILNPKSPQADTPTRTLLGEADDYEPFRISFEKLNDEYDSRQAIAREGITRLEAGIDGLPLTQQDLIRTLGETSERVESFSMSAADDALFPLVALRNDFIPAAEKELEGAGTLGESDPVKSFETLIPEASRLVTEAELITRTIEAFRSIDLPVMQRSVERIGDRGRSTSWVDDSLANLVTKSEQLAKRGIETSIAEDWAGFDDDLTQLKGRVLGCERLAARIADETLPKIEATRKEVVSAQAELGGILELKPEQLLSEAGLSPGEKLDQASLGVETALAAIDRGQALNAQHDLGGVEASLDDATAMIALSRECVERHASIMTELTADREELLLRVDPVSKLLGELQDNYAPTVLLFSSRFGEAVEGQLTVVECIDRARKRLETSGTELEQTQSAFSAGDLIRAYGLLETVANELGFARHQLALVEDQHAALRKAEKENLERAEFLKSRHRELSTLASDPRTIQSTIDLLREAGEKAGEFAVSLKAELSDPFVLFRIGEELDQWLTALKDGIAGDWNAFELAETAETSARAALTFCHQYLNEARNDKIPDSRILTRAIQRHGELTEDLGQIEKALEEDHADWNDIFAQISEIDGETAKVKATLEEQLTAAREAAEKLKQATREIGKLQAWRSSHSVALNRNSGNGKLREAKRALALGEYAAARAAAISAQGASTLELQRAKTKEAKKAREAAAAAAAARRAAWSSSSSSSSFSSGSSFSSSSSSGFSSSSFSSGSGFSRSGW